MKQIWPVLTVGISIVFSVIANAAVTHGADSHQKDHEALKAMLKVGTKAINTRNFDLFQPILDKDKLTVISVDGQKLESFDAFKDYWNDLFVEKTTHLDRIEVNPVADGPTEFLSDNVGICHGKSNDQYFFKNGEVRTMPERWTAVMVKEGSDWKLSRLIFSANILDNPVLGVLEQTMQMGIAIAAVAGFVLGLLTGWLIFRKKA